MLIVTDHHHHHHQVVLVDDNDKMIQQQQQQQQHYHLKNNQQIQHRSKQDINNGNVIYEFSILPSNYYYCFSSPIEFILMKTKKNNSYKNKITTKSSLPFEI